MQRTTNCSKSKVELSLRRAHFSLAKSGELWPLAQASARSASQCAGPGQGVPQALARARNRTCMELSSVLDGRTRFEPGSGSFSSSIGCVKSCRGAIVRSTACAEFCFFIPVLGM
eukprot:scaffold714_cov121-Isochrysis_galbana.AAC.9